MCRQLISQRAMNDSSVSNAGKSASATRLQFQTNLPQRILVVDDDNDARSLSAKVLKGSGYEVDTAEDGAAAWKVLQDKVFNLLITDNHMPKLTGVELVKKLRSARMTLPVIMATRKLPMEALGKTPSLKLSALLPKPFSIEDLLEAVRAVLCATNSAPE